jgi:hypothetical protein
MLSLAFDRRTYTHIHPSSRTSLHCYCYSPLRVPITRILASLLLLLLLRRIAPSSSSSSSSPSSSIMLLLRLLHVVVVLLLLLLLLLVLLLPGRLGSAWDKLTGCGTQGGRSRRGGGGGGGRGGGIVLLLLFLLLFLGRLGGVGVFLAARLVFERGGEEGGGGEGEREGGEERCVCVSWERWHYFCFSQAKTSI